MIPSKRKVAFLGSSSLVVLVVLLMTLGLSCSKTPLAAEELLEDQRGDLKACHSIESSCSRCRIRPPAKEMGEELPFIDILAASVEKTKDANPLLVMKLKVADVVPAAPSMPTTYSFALDLDGDPDTGFRADQSPLGIFPDLGVDLWVNLSLKGGSSESLVFIGPKNIKELNPTPGALEYSYRQERKTVVFKISVKPIERKLTFAYLHKKPLFRVELEEMDWVGFTTKSTSYYPADNPICDFHPDHYFQEGPEGCLLRLPNSS